MFDRISVRARQAGLGKVARGVMLLPFYLVGGVIGVILTGVVMLGRWGWGAVVEGWADATGNRITVNPQTVWQVAVVTLLAVLVWVVWV